MLIIQENEDTLQKAGMNYKKLSNNYNFNISTTKTKFIAFQGKYTSLFPLDWRDLKLPS
jgi:hypothetical protein